MNHYSVLFIIISLFLAQVNLSSVNSEESLEESSMLKENNESMAQLEVQVSGMSKKALSEGWFCRAAIKVAKRYIKSRFIKYCKRGVHKLISFIKNKACRINKYTRKLCKYGFVSKLTQKAKQLGANKGCPAIWNFFYGKLKRKC
jgi:hypothetical protein